MCNKPASYNKVSRCKSTSLRLYDCCRLAADTTTVSDQVCLNLNVALRSVTQAAMVLVFMFAASWRLTVVTFIIIPVILAICKLYGQYYR